MVVIITKRDIDYLTSWYVLKEFGGKNAYLLIGQVPSSQVAKKFIFCQRLFSLLVVLIF